MATTFISDTFTEASDTALASHTPETGGAWAAHGSYAATASVVASEDRVAGSSSTVTALYLNATTPPAADYEVRWTARLTVGGSSSRCGAAARFSSGANTGYLLWYTSTKWQLQRLNAGVTTILGDYDGSEALNTDYAMRLVLCDRSIQFYIDGTLRIDVHDDEAPILTAGQVGLFTRSGDRVDNFQAMTLDQVSARLSQVVAEVVSGGVPSAQLSQVVAEVVSSGVPVAQLSQVVIEVISANIATIASARPVVFVAT